MKHLLQDVLKESCKGGLIGVGVTMAIIFIGSGICFAPTLLLSIFIYGFGIGFFLTASNLFVQSALDHYFPSLLGWKIIGPILCFFVSVPLFYLYNRLVIRLTSLFAMDDKSLLLFSLGAGIVSIMVGFYYIYSQEKEGRIYQEREFQRLAILKERNRIAQELHDSVSQNFYGISLYLSTLERVQNTDKEAFYSSLQILQEMIAETQIEMGLLIYELAPQAEKKGFFQALDKLTDLYSTRYKLTIETVFHGEEERLKDGTRNALYRVSQEALNNVIKHSKADRARLSLQVLPSGSSILSIEDDGIGFELADLKKTKQYGIRGMRERLEGIGGHLIIETAEGQGTVIRAIFPLD